MRSRIAAVVNEQFSWLEPHMARLLAALDTSQRPGADAAAILLGHDLQLAPLARYRAFLEREHEVPPPLWRFPWEPSACWQTQAWRSLPFEARQLRARAGSLAHDVEHRATAHILEMDSVQYAAGLDALRRSGACTSDTPPVLRAIADALELRTDLALVELIAHWLRMLAHADRVLRTRTGNGFDVGGYSGACSACRQRWGARPRAMEYVPPFHPGCRCFAQPRFAP